MREAGRHEERPAIARRELDPGPLPARRRSGADVDRDVEHPTGEAAHELRVGLGRGLEMHAAQRQATPVRRDVALGAERRQARGGEGLGAVAALEAAARILDAGRLHEHDARKGGGNEAHGPAPAA
jgi:hypothetical protein